MMTIPLLASNVIFRFTTTRISWGINAVTVVATTQLIFGAEKVILYLNELTHFYGLLIKLRTCIHVFKFIILFRAVPYQNIWPRTLQLLHIFLLLTVWLLFVPWHNDCMYNKQHQTKFHVLFWESALHRRLTCKS